MRAVCRSHDFQWLYQVRLSMPPKKRGRGPSESDETTTPPDPKRLKSEETFTIVCSIGEDGGSLPETYRVVHPTQEAADKFFTWILGIQEHFLQISLVDYFQSLARSGVEIHSKEGLEGFIKENSLLPETVTDVTNALKSIEYGIECSGRWTKISSEGIIKVGNNGRLVYLYNWC